MLLIQQNNTNNKSNTDLASSPLPKISLMDLAEAVCFSSDLGFDLELENTSASRLRLKDGCSILLPLPKMKASKSLRIRITAVLSPGDSMVKQALVQW